MENLKQITTVASENLLIAGSNAARRYARIVNQDATHPVLVRVGSPVDGSNVDQKLLLTFSAVPQAGTYKLKFANYGQTAALAFNAAAAAIQTAVRLLVGLESVTVTGDYTAGFEVTLDDVSFPPPNLEVVESSLVRTQVNTTANLEILDTPNIGTFQIKVVKEVDENLTEIISAPIAHNATLQTVLRQLMNDSQLTYSTNTITFIKDAGLIQRVEILNNQLTKTELQLIKLELDGDPASGSFKLKFGELETADIDHDDNEGAVQTKIRALTGFDDILVSGAPTDEEFTIQMVGFNFDQELPTIEDNTLETAGSDPIAFTVTQELSYELRKPVGINAGLLVKGSQPLPVITNVAIDTEAESTTYGTSIPAESEAIIETKNNIYAFGNNAVALDIYEGF